MHQKQQKHIIDLLFVIALFCLFALSAIFLISIGADIYGKTMTNMEHNFDARTSLAYVTEKIRQSDQMDQIAIGNLDDCPALVITYHTSDSTYITYIYEFNGYLKELMIKDAISLGPEAGQNILEIKDFQVRQINDQLISCIIETTDEQTYDLLISLHSGGVNVEY